ncbi:MAG: hypothetical protein MO852_09365 [Candidatus Devosia euplotis]|nr:hypothetical protein [Candidatus Devosia euplotis]
MEGSPELRAVCQQVRIGVSIVFLTPGGAEHVLANARAIWQARGLVRPVPDTAQLDIWRGDGSSADNDQLVPDIYPADPVLSNGDWLREAHDAPFDVDWSIALRGSYTKAASGERFDILLVSSVELDHTGARSNVKATGSAKIVRPNQGEINVSALRLSGTVDYALDNDTILTGAAISH